MNSVHPLPDEAAITALVGHRFPGGNARLAHWENVLLTGCTGVEPLPDGMAHPIALFHLPIQGAGTSIADMFALGQAESDLSIMIEDYQWEFLNPLCEETDYRFEGEVTLAERHHNAAGQVYDRIRFLFDVAAPDGTAVARSQITWHFTRNTL